MAYVAEVAARFGTTLLDVTHVRDCYRVGTAPDVDLAVDVAGLRSFPVVTDLVVRVPAGVAATCDGELVTGEQRLGECAIVMRLGRVVLTISRIEAAATLPRPELDRRPAAYHAVSLVAHLLVWAIAIVFALPEHRRKLAPIIVARPRVAHIAAHVPPPPRVPPLPPKQPAQSKRSSDPQIVPREQIEAARAHGDLRSAPDTPAIEAPRTPIEGFAQGAAKLAAKLAEIDVTKRLEEVGPLYDPDADHPNDFGHARSFDPTARPEFGTIATGRFATTDRGAAAGENYSIEAEHEQPHVRLCDGACVAIGALERDAITDRIGYKKRQLATCYRAGIPDELRFELDISANGKVSDTRVPGPIGGCIAKVIASVTFPAAASDTRVAYSLTFEPPYGPPGTHVPGAARRAHAPAGAYARVQRGGTE